MIWNYLEEFRADYAEDKKWRILGLEIPFDQLLYSVKDPLGEKNDIQIGFKGSIDRLDAYLEKDGILWLRVIDYKTGKPSTKKTEIIADEQIQHVVYALAAEKYAKEHKQELEDLFGGTIRDIALESAKYVFPHKGGDERFLDVDTVKKISNRCGKVFEMPQAVTQLLWNVFAEKNYSKKNPDCTYCTYKRQCLKKIGTEM
jgi:CRISPR/Cas system-associated exonuclease Cas4 (RecB family)